MNQKGSVNIILVILVIVLAGALAYVTLVKKPTSQKNEQPQNVSEQTPVLTDGAALALVKSTWGDCTPDSCSRVVASVTKQESGTYLVTAIYEGLRDDSSGAQRKVAVATYHNGIWTLGTPTITQQCQPGRGHQDFSSEPCR
jgi:hypothetical protein